MTISSDWLTVNKRMNITMAGGLYCNEGLGVCDLDHPNLGQRDFTCLTKERLHIFSDQSE